MMENVANRLHIKGVTFLDALEPLRMLFRKREVFGVAFPYPPCHDDESFGSHDLLVTGSSLDNIARDEFVVDVDSFREAFREAGLLSFSLALPQAVITHYYIEESQERCGLKVIQNGKVIQRELTRLTPTNAYPSDHTMLEDLILDNLPWWGGLTSFVDGMFETERYDLVVFNKRF